MQKHLIRVFFACFFSFCSLVAIDVEKFYSSITECPEWMNQQITSDLKYLENTELSLSKINELFRQTHPALFLVKFEINNNIINVEKYFKHPCIDERIASFLSAFHDLSKLVQLPNVTFFIYMHDGLITFGPAYEFFPLFVMSRDIANKNSILIPDYQAITSKYQVLGGEDITKYVYPWNKKKAKLIWRGSIDQTSYDNSVNVMTSNNTHLFSRVRLCELSREFPHLINAKFTFFKNENVAIPYLDQFGGSWIDYKELLKYNIKC